MAKLNGFCEIDENSDWNFSENDSGVRIKLRNTNLIFWVCSEHGRRSAYSDMCVGIRSWDVDKKYFNAVRSAKKARGENKDSEWRDSDSWVWKYLPDEYLNWGDGEVLSKCLRDEKFKQGLINSIIDCMKEIIDVLQQVK